MSGIHLNLMPVRRDPKMLSDPTPEESRYLEELQVWLKEETGYQWIQGTRPQTLAFALTDSPVGLAAWIVEKFRAWSDCGGDVEAVFTKDQLLANISLYWFTGAIGSSFWPYYARMHGPWPIPDGETVAVPTGYCEFPREILRPPRSVAERTFSNIQPLERDGARRAFRGHGAARGSRGGDPGIFQAASPSRGRRRWMTSLGPVRVLGEVTGGQHGPALQLERHTRGGLILGGRQAAERVTGFQKGCCNSLIPESMRAAREVLELLDRLSPCAPPSFDGGRVGRPYEITPR